MGNDDMDLFVAIRKLDEEGNWLPVNVLGEPHPGAWGKMRVSRRELDPKLSTDFQPVQAHRKDEKLKPGEIVPVDIEIWPHSRIWHKGQQLQVLVSGHYDSRRLVRALLLGDEQQGQPCHPLRRQVRLVPSDTGHPAEVSGRGLCLSMTSAPAPLARGKGNGGGQVGVTGVAIRP